MRFYKEKEQSSSLKKKYQTINLQSFNNNSQYVEAEKKGCSAMNLFCWDYVKSEHWFNGSLIYTNELKACP